MKFALTIAAALIATSASAFTCNYNEAQFIGTVTSVRVYRIDQGVRDCYVKIQFSDFKPSQICPIDEMAAQSTEILDSDCRSSLEAGQTVSGYLIEGKDGQIRID